MPFLTFLFYSFEFQLFLYVNHDCSFQAGFSALHLAAQNGHNQSARVLLYANCNADQKNNVSLLFREHRFILF